MTTHWIRRKDLRGVKAKEREREQLEFECVQKDDEAAAKWLKLVSSCGLFFSPNIQMGVHIYHIHTYIWLYIYVHACIFFYFLYSAHLHCLPRSGKWICAYLAYYFTGLLCGMWHAACGKLLAVQALDKLLRFLTGSSNTWVCVCVFVAYVLSSQTQQQCHCHCHCNP